MAQCQSTMPSNLVNFLAARMHRPRMAGVRFYHPAGRIRTLASADTGTQRRTTMAWVRLYHPLGRIRTHASPDTGDITSHPRVAGAQPRTTVAWYDLSIRQVEFVPSCLWKTGTIFINSRVNSYLYNTNRALSLAKAGTIPSLLLQNSYQARQEANRSTPTTMFYPFAVNIAYNDFGSDSHPQREPDPLYYYLVLVKFV